MQQKLMRHIYIHTYRCVLTSIFALVLISYWFGCSACGGEIHDSARSGDLTAVKFLLKQNPSLVSSRDTNNIQPLTLAIAGHHADVAEFLLLNHADPNDCPNITAPPFVRSRPLHIAVYYGYNDEVVLLLKCHADINAKDGNGETPLHFAVRYFRTNIVELLLTNKADANMKDNRGNTALHYAVASGPIEQVKALIACHADINAINTNHQTPLHLVVESEVNGERAARLLLQAGADVNLKDDQGRTPLQFAELLDKKKLVEAMRQHGAK